MEYINPSILSGVEQDATQEIINYLDEDFSKLEVRKLVKSLAIHLDTYVEDPLKIYAITHKIQSMVRDPSSGGKCIPLIAISSGSLSALSPQNPPDLSDLRLGYRDTKAPRQKPSRCRQRP